jgi:hypothetical protein
LDLAFLVERASDGERVARVPPVYRAFEERRERGEEREERESA